MTRSFDLGPPTESPGTLFLNSQFRSPVQWPPKDTRIDGKVAIITGSNSGLGFESARQLLAMGLSRLILAVRSADKGQKAATKLSEQYPEANIQVWLLDMDSYESIQVFANRANAELSRLDIVILNAGVQLPYFTTNPRTKHENSIQVNYLSTMLLAILMLPILKAKRTEEQPGRLTIVNSGTARGSTLSEPAGTPILAALDDRSRPWQPVARYAVSKMLAHLFIIELVQRVKVEDGVIVNLVDPGLVRSTNLQGRAPAPVVAFFYLYKAILARSLAVGGTTYVDAAVVKGAESHGCYVANWKISSYAAFLYTPEGEAARKQLWEETMDEFEFVDARGILAALKK